MNLDNLWIQYCFKTWDWMWMKIQDHPWKLGLFYYVSSSNSPLLSICELLSLLQGSNQHYNINYVKKLVALQALLPKILEVAIFLICISLHWRSIVPAKVFATQISRMDAHKTLLELHLPLPSTQKNGCCKDFKPCLRVVVARS